MTVFATDPVDVPDHVTVSVPLHSAAFVVECSRCCVTEWLYHVAVFRDPGAIGEAVDLHRDCLAGSGPGAHLESRSGAGADAGAPR